MRRLAFSLGLLLGMWLAQGEAADVTENLALAPVTGMPSALASWPHMRFSAQKACDDAEGTGWVSQANVYPVWLRVEWPLPVEVSRIDVLPFLPEGVPEVGRLGRYRIEILTEGEWQTVAEGDGTTAAEGEALSHRFSERVMTSAVRLVAESGPKACIGVAELRVTGPKLVVPAEWAPRWQGRWIWCEPSLVIPHREPLRRYFRRSFTVEDPTQIKEAWLLGCAFDRLNNMWLNNRPVLSHSSLYGGSLRKATVRQLTSDRFVSGENVIAAEVDDIYECGSHGLLAELLIRYFDGRCERIVTDSSWFGQQDQGVVPDWRKAGLKDKRWVPCVVKTWPNTRLHWSWNVPYPNVSPEEQLRLVQLTATPSRVPPGEHVSIKLTLETAGPLCRDYAVVLRLGQASFSRNHDFELWGGALLPEELKTSQWEPGRHEVELTVPVPTGAPDPMPVTLLVSTPDSAARVTCDLDRVTTDVYGVHFLLPVVRGSVPVTGDTAAGFPGCEVRMLRGTPTLFINDRSVPPVIWSSSYGSYQRYSDYAASGVRIFRPRIVGGPICAPGEEEDYYRTWFAEIDRIMEAALAVDSEIWLLPALSMDPHPEWLFAEPTEQMLGGRGDPVIKLSYAVPDRGQVRPTFMSLAWRVAGARGLRRLVEHMASRPYASRVIGLCLFAGRAGENYWGGNERNVFRNEAGQYDVKKRSAWDVGDFSMAARRTFRAFLLSKYGSVDRLRKAWCNPRVTFDDILDPAALSRQTLCDYLVWVDKDGEAGSLRDPLKPGVGCLPMDYLQCFSEAMIDSFAAWGRAVKEASGGALIAGCFYGYAIPQMYTSIPGFHGHTAVAKACRTPWLDFFVSPSEYGGARRAGHPYWGLSIQDSLRLHKKLWIYEQDTRTFLAEHMPKTFSRSETLEVLKRDAAAALTHASGWWWYEFSKGMAGALARSWFSDPAILELAGRLKSVYERGLTFPQRGPTAEIAVFYHGESLTAQDLFAPTAQINITISRLTFVNAMQRIGAPFDFYNLADIPVLNERGMLDRYRLCIFLNPFYLTPPERSSLDLCKGRNRTLLWLWGPGIAGSDRSPHADNVAELTEIPGIRALDRRAVQSYQLCAPDHPLNAGLEDAAQFTALPFPPGATWERFGNEVWPVLYVDGAQCGKDTDVLGKWVLDGEVAPGRVAYCARRIVGGKTGNWRSVYAAVPLLNARQLRNLAREAGVHIYWEGDEVLFAGAGFVALHTGKQAAEGVLRLPKAGTAHDVFSGKIVRSDAQQIAVDMAPYSTSVWALWDSVDDTSRGR